MIFQQGLGNSRILQLLSAGFLKQAGFFTTAGAKPKGQRNARIPYYVIFGLCFLCHPQTLLFVSSSGLTRGSLLANSRFSSLRGFKKAEAIFKEFQILAQEFQFYAQEFQNLAWEFQIKEFQFVGILNSGNSSLRNSLLKFQNFAQEFQICAVL